MSERRRARQEGRRVSLQPVGPIAGLAHGSLAAGDRPIVHAALPTGGGLPALGARKGLSQETQDAIAFGRRVSAQVKRLPHIAGLVRQARGRGYSAELPPLGGVPTPPPPLPHGEEEELRPGPAQDEFFGNRPPTALHEAVKAHHWEPPPEPSASYDPGSPSPVSSPHKLASWQAPTTPLSVLRHTRSFRTNQFSSKVHNYAIVAGETLDQLKANPLDPRKAEQFRSQVAELRRLRPRYTTTLELERSKAHYHRKGPAVLDPNMVQLERAYQAFRQQYAAAENADFESYWKKLVHDGKEILKHERSEDLTALKAVLYSAFDRLKSTFKHYCLYESGESSLDQVTIPYLRFEELIKDAGLLAKAHCEGKVTRAEAQLLFIRANWCVDDDGRQTHHKDDEHKNPKHALVPHEFFTSMVLLATSCFPKVRPMAKRVHELLDDHVLPGTGCFEPGEVLHVSRMLPRVQVVMNKRRNMLKDVFDAFSAGDKLDNINMLEMNIGEFKQLVAYVDPEPLGITTQLQREAFLAAQRCSYKETVAGKDNGMCQLTFIEFLDAMVFLSRKMVLPQASPGGAGEMRVTWADGGGEGRDGEQHEEHEVHPEDDLARRIDKLCELLIDGWRRQSSKIANVFTLGKLKNRAGKVSLRALG